MPLHLSLPNRRKSAANVEDLTTYATTVLL